MANNKKKEKKGSKLILFNPNPCNNEGIPTEDLSIIVDLTTIRRGRSVISLNNVTGSDDLLNNQPKKSDIIGFINGTEVGGGKRALTTSYLEANSTFNPSDPDRDLESLGIESINIDFDTAYTPIVKIKFIDIRGHSVFQQGNESKYKMFFELPYPIFNLTVKGFFGQAVKYCLHLTKWNSSFNSQTGNFEIDAEFIGYTYALLTDLLIGYIRAVVHTEIGKKIFEEYQKEWADGDKVLKTIDDMLQDIQKLGDEFDKIKQSDGSVKLLANSNKINDIINLIESRLITLTNSIVTDKNFFNNGRGILVTNINKGNSDEVKNTIDAYKSRIKKEVTDKNLYKEVTNDNLKLSSEELTNIIEIRGIKGKNLTITEDAVTAVLKITKGSYDEKAEKEENSPSFNYVYNLMKDVKNGMPPGFAINNPETEIVIFDMRKVYLELNTKKKNLNNNDKEIRLTLGNKLANIAKEQLKFEPTIHNIFSVLTVHCEVFLKTINIVSINAEKNTTRADALKGLSKNGLNYPNGSSFFAWPEFKHKKNNQDGFVETWIGDKIVGLGDKANDVDEVKFIEELLSCLTNLVQQDDNLLLAENNSISPQFWPVSPLDVAIRSDSQILQNPYAEALETNLTNGTADEATRLLIMRGFLGLGLANESIAPRNNQFLGRMEAENLFDVIKKMDNPIGGNLMTSINNQFQGNWEQKTEKLIAQWVKGVASTVKNPSGIIKPLMIIDSGSTVNYIYNYIGSAKDKRWYIPISGGFDGQDFYNEENLKDEKGLKLLASKILFTGSHINNTSNALNKGVKHIWDVRGLTGTTGEPKYPNDGSIYLKILTESEYNSRNISPSYGNEIISKDYYSDSDNPIDSKIKQSTLKPAAYENGVIETIQPYNSKYKVLEISSIIYDGAGGDTNNEGIHFKMKDAKDEQESSVLCNYWHQANADNHISDMGGTYLSRSIFEDSRGGVTAKRNNEYDMDFENPGKLILADTTGENWSRIKPKDFGKQRELIGDLLGLTSEPNEDIHIPFIEFGVTRKEGTQNRYFSLFGSQFYYEQSPEGKALLFLHSFGWNGCIGDIGDTLISTNSIDVSMFDLYQEDGTSFQDEDDTFTLKSLFNTNGSFIKAPRLWCAFIGGLLYRLDTSLKNKENKDFIKYSGEKSDGSFYNFFPWQDEKSSVPYFWEYIYDSRPQSQFGINFVFDKGDFIRNDLRQTPEELITEIYSNYSPVNAILDYLNPSRSNYPVVDRGILGLPQQVRDEFKDVFTSFVSEFQDNLAPKLEIVDNYNRADWESKWNALNLKVVPNPLITSQTSNKLSYSTSDVINIFATNSDNSENPQLLEAIKNYNFITIINDQDWEDSSGPAHMFSLELKSNSEASSAANIIKGYIKETYVIANGVPGIFRTDKTRQDNILHNRNIKVNKSEMDLYLTSFYERFDKLTQTYEKEKKEGNDEAQSRIFNSIDDDMIKLNLYRSVASIYNKWVAGTNDALVNGCGGDIANNNLNKEAALHHRGSSTPHFIDSFRFLDRSFNNIGDDFYLNPLDVFNKIVGNYNQSFFDVANATLIKNNFNFIALPTFLNFNDPKQMKTMFTPFTYKDVAGGDYAAGPSFVCVYVGQSSTNLDLGTNSNYPDDGITIESDCEGNYIGGAPVDFTGERSEDGSLSIPLFLVKYGQQNQSFFKDIKLDQREFAETAESLEIIEDISLTGDKRKPNYNGQNLFNVYQTRSYSAEVEMMGNAMIQPMMYFQLDNIPMFRGAYLIMKVSHTINAHQMTTKFKGSRVKRTKTPLIDKSTLFMSLLGTLESLGENRIIGGSATRGVRRTNSTIDSVANWIDTPMDIKLIPIKFVGATGEKATKEQGFVMKQIGDTARYGIREVVEVLQTVFQEFHKDMKNNENINDVVFVGDLSIINGGISVDHASHQIGRDVDFRQIVSKKQSTNSTNFDGNFFSTESLACKSNTAGCHNTNNGLVAYPKEKGGTINLWDPEGDTRDTIGNYSRAGTRALIKLLIKYTDPSKGKNTKTVDGKKITFPQIENIWFNDPVLAEEFPRTPGFGGVAVMEDHSHHLHVKFAIPKRVREENGTIDSSGNPLSNDGSATMKDSENTRRFSS